MPILKFLPYESFSIVTKLTPDVVQARLQHELTFNDNRDSTYTDRFSVPDTYFKGFSGKYKFNIKPYINYSNWFLPKILGSIDPFGDGSQVHVKMTLSKSVTMLITIWLCVIGAACVFVGILAFRIITVKGVQHYLDNFNYLALLPFVMFILGQILTISAFKQESRKSRQFMVDLFEGEIK